MRCSASPQEAGRRASGRAANRRRTLGPGCPRNPLPNPPPGEGASSPRRANRGYRLRHAGHGPGPRAAASCAPARRALRGSGSREPCGSPFGTTALQHPPPDGSPPSSPRASARGARDPGSRRRCIRRPPVAPVCPSLRSCTRRDAVPSTDGELQTPGRPARLRCGAPRTRRFSGGCVGPPLQPGKQAGGPAGPPQPCTTHDALRTTYYVPRTTYHVPLTHPARRTWRSPR